MSDKRPTDWQGIVHCPTLEIKKKVVALAVECGWGNLPLDEFSGYDMVGFGWWRKGAPDLVHGHGVEEHRSMKPTFPVLHGVDDWDKLVCILRGEPEFDTTPLPYDMKPELQSSTMAKFNLSPEQWDTMPLMVREALAGCEVKQAHVEFAWVPIATPPSSSQTVFLTCEPRASHNSASSQNAIGFWDDESFTVTQGRLASNRVTHWCPMPGGDVQPEPEEEQE